jgi:hypothetical protein
MYRMGMGQDGPDDLDITGLVPATGPDANQVAALQVGQLAAQTQASGQYSVNPATGQLIPNTVAGVSNSTLLLIAAGAMAFVFFIGAVKR